MPNESIGKLQDMLTRTTATVGVKTSVFVGSAKVRTNINTVKKEINNLYLELGTMVYESWKKEELDPELIEQQCLKIKEKFENIEELETEIAKLEQQEAKVLGAKRQEEKAMPSFICPNCRTAFDSPIKFCRKCGTKMAGRDIGS